MNRPDNHADAARMNREAADSLFEVAAGKRAAASADPFEDKFARNARSVRGRSRYVAGTMEDVAFANSGGRSTRTT
jgi:hypothetical protein